MNDPVACRRRWPYVLWLAMLALPAIILAWFAYRLLYGPPPGAFLWALAAAAVLCILGGILALGTAGGRTWIQGHRRKFAAAAGASLFTLVFVDLMLTATGTVPTIGQLRARSLEYRPGVLTRSRLVPKSVRGEGAAAIVINSRGYRGEEIEIPKPAGVKRVIVLGGSQVFDRQGVDWPAQAGVLLARRGKSINVVNAGVPGHAAPDAIGKVLSDLWVLEPDALVLCNAWSDLTYFTDLTPSQPYGDIVTPPQDWRLHPRGLDWLLSLSALYRHERNWVVPILSGEEDVPPHALTGKVSPWALTQYKLSLQTFCDLGANLGVKVALCKQARLPAAASGTAERNRIGYSYVGMDHDELLAAFEACDRIIDEVAARKNCTVIDMSALSGQEDCFTDHIQFSPAGSRQAAKILADALVTLVP